MATVKSIDVALRATTTEFEAGMGRGSAALNAFDSNFNRVEAQMKKATQLFNTGGISVDEFGKTIRECDQELKAMDAGFSSLGAATQRAQAILKGMETETDRYNAKLKELDGLLKLNRMTQEQHAAAVAHTTAEYKKAIPAAELVGQKSSWLGSMMGPMTASILAAATAMKAIQIASNLARSAIHGVAAQIEEVDSAKKAAATIGMATGELMKLRFAVDEVAGVAIDDPLKKMVQIIAEAAITGKGATDTINRIGLSVSSLAAMSPEKAFFAITDAISALGGTGERQAAAVDLFGKAGKDLGPIFEGGAAALKESAKFAEKFGLSVSEIDASAIEQANDSLKRLSAILDGVYRQIAVELAPQIIAFGKTIFEMSGESNNAIGKIRSAFTFAGLAASMFVDSVKDIVTELARMVLPPQLSLAVDLFIKGKSAVDDVSSAMAGSKTFAMRYSENLEKVNKQLAEMEAKTKKDFTIGGKFNENTEGFKKSKATEAAKELAKNNKAVADAERKAKTVRDMEREVSGNSPDVKFKHTVEDINELLKNQLITLEKRNALVAMAHKTIVEEPAAKKELEAGKKRITEAAQFTAGSSPMAKFASEAEKIRKLELFGELTQQQAAAATLDARKDALAAMIKLNTEARKGVPQIPTPPTMQFQQPKIPTFHLPEFQTPQPSNATLPADQNRMTDRQIIVPTQAPGNALMRIEDRSQIGNRFDQAKPFYDAQRAERAKVAASFTPRPTPTTATPAMTGASEEMALRQEAMKARGAEITRSLEHPFVAFQRTVDELQGMKNVGAINATTMAAGVMEARQKAMEEVGKRPEIQAAREVKGPAALEAGSQAAFSAFQENRRNDNNGKSLENLTKKMESHLAKLARGGVVLAAANL